MFDFNLANADYKMLTTGESIFLNSKFFIHLLSEISGWFVLETSMTEINANEFFESILSNLEMSFERNRKILYHYLAPLSLEYLVYHNFLCKELLHKKNLRWWFIFT